jgi:hypothetical protein
MTSSTHLVHSPQFFLAENLRGDQVTWLMPGAVLLSSTCHVFSFRMVMV